MTLIRLVLKLYVHRARATLCTSFYKNLQSLLVLEIPLAQYPGVEDMFFRAAFFSKACLLFSNDLLFLWFRSVQHHLQHDLTGVAYWADGAVKSHIVGCCPWSRSSYCQPDLVTGDNESIIMKLRPSPPPPPFTCTNSPGNCLHIQSLLPHRAAYTPYYFNKVCCELLLWQ